jgi:CspA family cold shock protein
MTSTWTAQDVSAMQTVCIKAFAPIRASIDVSEPMRNSPGTTLVVQIGKGAKGAQVSSMLKIGETAESPPPRGTQRRFGDATPRSQGRPRIDSSSAVSVLGEVKWFNPTKGFGFIQADDGLKDIFVHASVVSAAGLATLEERQRLRIQAVTTPKGREAVSIKLLDE